MDHIGERQRLLLQILLKRKQGCGIEEVAEALGITRPAARQHLAALLNQGYLERAQLVSTGGRPSQTYRLSAKGYELFPKQYSWFSEVLVERLERQMGAEALGDFMGKLGADVAAQVAARVQGKDLGSRVREVAAIMNELAFQAETAFTGKEMPGSPPVIEASNCVYHALAQRFPQVCAFDVALLSKLTGSAVVHETCIVRGGETCRFRFKKR